MERQVRNQIDEYSGRVRLLKTALSWIENYERKLSSSMLNGTSKIQGMLALNGLEVYGLKDPSRTDQRVPTFSFNIVGADPHKVAECMWEKHAIALLAENNGGFYSRALRTYGRSVATRASPVHFNTIPEVETFLSSLADAISHLNAN